MRYILAEDRCCRSVRDHDHIGMASLLPGCRTPGHPAPAANLVSLAPRTGLF
jgi:hypothetical protein